MGNHIAAALVLPCEWIYDAHGFPYTGNLAQ